jgi:hypothetical protein
MWPPTDSKNWLEQNVLGRRGRSRYMVSEIQAGDGPFWPIRPKVDGGLGGWLAVNLNANSPPFAAYPADSTAHLLRKLPGESHPH